MSKANLNQIITNAEILKLAKSDPVYQSWTAKLTDDIFTEKGFEALQYADARMLSDFFNMSVRIWLGQITRPNVNIPQTFEKIVERMSNPMGGIQQRIQTYLVKPIDPAYRNLQDNGSVDPYTIRKPKTTEDFYVQNFDFANALTIQRLELKKMFLDPSGISDYISGIMYGFDQAKTIQEYELTREMMSKILNSTNYPLRASQKLEVEDLRADGTDNAKMSKWLQVFHNLHDVMKSTVCAGEFNAKGYEHGTNPSNYVLYVRLDLLNLIKTTLLATTYHTENLGLPFTVVGVKDFGGLTYKTTGDVDLFPVYSTKAGNKGEMLGYNGDGQETTPLVSLDNMKTVDPNEKVDAVLVQKGAIFMSEQNGYETNTIFNPKGLYTNYFVSQPNKTIGYDPHYDVIKFYHA